MSKKKRSSQEQKHFRRRRNERAFLFDKEYAQCIGEVDREKWELAISIHGGDVARAALECGIPDVPKGAKTLWGRSAEEALATYRRWKKKETSRST
jgi:hypothetical protein